MKITFDLEQKQVSVEGPEPTKKFDIFSKDSFQLLTKLWVKIGWVAKYNYSFTWMGRPVIQLPDDMLRIQELIYRLKPDVIVETGVAHGGMAVFYASLCKVLGKGKVVGVDIEIRPHNRKALEEHFLKEYIELIEGSSTDPRIVAQVQKQIKPSDRVIVLLDSNHGKEHVFNELKAYAPLVTKDSYLVVMDGLMPDLVGAPRTQADWEWNNPISAMEDFLKESRDFKEENPGYIFNEGITDQYVTHWPRGYLKKI